MGDVTSTTVLSETNKFDQDALNSPPALIIKRENLGLEPHQQQQYQFNLLNRLGKSDRYYDDLGKMRDRLKKPAPTMQEVVQADMKRVKTNKVFERQLHQNVSGPRGLIWQQKQALQRLRNDELDVTRDLSRLKRDLGRMAVALYIDQAASTGESSSLSQALQSKKRSHSIKTSKSSSFTHRSDGKHPKRSASIEIDSDDLYLYQHARTIEEEKRHVEQKLKKFFL